MGRSIFIWRKQVCTAAYGCLWWILLLTHAGAQDYEQFDRISLQEGLSNDFVSAIFKDHQGFVWIATQNGLNRYDGYEFSIFKHHPEDPFSLSGNYIEALFEDKEHRLWVVTDHGLDLLDRNTGKVQRMQLRLEEDINTEIEITCVFEGKKGRIWVGSATHGLWIWDSTGVSNPYPFRPYSHPALPQETLWAQRINQIEADDQGNLWIGSALGLYRLDLERGNLARYFPQANVRGIQWDESGRLYVGVSLNGIFRLTTGGQFVRLPELTQDFRDTSQARPFFHSNMSDLCLSQSGHLWVATDIGLYRKPPQSGVFTHFYHVPGQSGTLSMNDVSCLMEDEQGMMWVGTYGGGISRWRPNKSPFQYIANRPFDPYSIPEGHVRAIEEDPQGNLWVGVVDKGLIKLVHDPQSGWRKAQNFAFEAGEAKGLSAQAIWALALDQGGKLWIGGHKSMGLDCLDPQSGSFTHFRHDADDFQSISSNNIGYLYADSRDHIWIGTLQAKGLNRLNPRTGKATRYWHDPDDVHSISSNRVMVITEGSEGNMWIGTFDGLNELDIQTGQMRRFYHDAAQQRSLSHNWILTLLADSRGMLWVGTNQGLNLYVPGRTGFQRFYEQDGLPSDRIHGLLEDQFGQVWISTDKGLVRASMKPAAADSSITLSFQVFDTQDGLRGGAFWRGVYAQGPKSGQLYFGTSHGFNIIYPDRITSDSFGFRPLVASVTRFREDAGSSTLWVDPFAAQQKRLVLWPGDRLVNVKFTDFDFQQTGKLQYAYRIEGYNESWIPLQDKRTIALANLSPGAYSLWVRGIRKGSVYAGESKLIDIAVHPPWYANNWAYALYLALFVSLLYAANRFHLNRQLEKQESKRLKELDRLKSRLYTNITHEFRTPLTVILGMAEHLEAAEELTPIGNIKRNLALIRRNGSNLLSLVNQMLDLSKAEKNQLEIHYIRDDIVKYIRYLTESFQSLANSNNVMLRIGAAEKEIIMDYDPEKFRKIWTNLLSNAIKYTPSGGQITVRIAVHTPSDTRFRPTELQLTVADTGPGISAEALPHIFDRFYQADDNLSRTGGTGIGLALTQELVNLLDGSIEVASEPGQGSTFIVRLPIRNEAKSVDGELLPAAPSPGAASAMLLKRRVAPVSNLALAEELPHLLLIEDNPDVVEYLSTSLEDDYQLDFAYNGQAGIEKAWEIVPDIIISDVMMPEKDGFELTETLKNDPRSSHIPIVLLTAKADVDSRITGLSRGADAYLRKPFHQRELSVVLTNLLALRKKLQLRYGSLNTPPPASSPERADSDVEDRFLQKLTQFVTAQLDNPALAPEAICQHMGMSRTNLYRKLKALTGLSLTFYLRQLRLQQAQHLLLHTDQDIAEIAYAVGFADPKYFSRVFSEAFQLSPRKYRQQ